MLLHNFDKSLQHERKFAERADRFYREQLKSNQINRYNNDNELDMSFQHRDIDVSITINGKTYNVSEKFRDTDFGDMYVEVYSKYSNVLGWIHTGEPDFISYFTPKAVYLISHKNLRDFCINKLFPAIPTKYFQEIFETGKTRIKKQIVISGKQVEITIIQAHNQTGNSSWKTIGVAVDFEILKFFGIKIKKY